MKLADLSTLWVIADVPQDRAERIGVGSPAEVTLGTTAGRRLSGEVSYLGAELDPRTRTVPVRIVVEGDPKLRPGMFATVEIEEVDPAAGEAPDRILAVPEAAVLLVEGERCVFTPAPGMDGSFERRVIGVGPAVGGWFPVLSGLDPGDRVVTEGAFLLKAELGKGAPDDD